MFAQISTVKHKLISKGENDENDYKNECYASADIAPFDIAYGETKASCVLPSAIGGNLQLRSLL